MPIIQEQATLWLASFALTFTVFGAYRLPTFWAHEYVETGMFKMSGTFSYFFFPIWAVVLSFQASLYAIFLQEPSNDLYYAFAILAIAIVGLMHTWNWLWNYPVHPIASAICAFLIWACQVAILVILIIYDSPNTLVWPFCIVPLVWFTAAFVLSAYAAYKLAPKWQEIKQNVQSRDENLNKYDTIPSSPPSDARASYPARPLQGHIANGAVHSRF